MAEEAGELPSGEGVAIKTPIFSATMKGKDIQMRDIVITLVLILTALTCYAVWEHKLDGKDGMALIAASLKEVAAAARQGAQAQRETNCIMRFENSKRETVYEFCKQLSGAP